MRKFAALLTLSVLALPILTSADGFDLSVPEKTPGGKKIPNQYIVMLKAKSAAKSQQDLAQEILKDLGIDSDAKGKVNVDVDAIVKKVKAKTLFTYGDAFNGFAAELSDAQVTELRADPSVADVVQDEEVFVSARAAAQALPTGIDRINAENRTNKGTGIEVAVLDTGVQATHPDLAGAVLGGVSCIKGETATDDRNGHGTHVAGTIAARANSVGVVGVAPEAKIWSVKVLDRQGSGSWSSIICGIDWVTARASRIKVANMSLGGGGTAGANCDASPLRKAICNSVNAGVTYVVAAGNENDDVKNHVPAAYPEVIAVSALSDSNGRSCGGGAATNYGPDDGFASFSNYATQSQDLARLIAAPGVSIRSTWKSSDYNSISGTSMASPHVAGAAALYIKANPGSTPAQVLAGLLARAEAPNVNLNGECGATGVSHASTTRHPEKALRADTL